MKKNLRIVSATAAALLAVAPVAAASVAPVFADIVLPGDSSSVNTSDSAVLNLKVTNRSSLLKGDSTAKVAATVVTPTVPAGATVTSASDSKIADVYKAGSVTVDDNGHLISSTNGADGKPNALPAKETTFADDNSGYVAVAYVSISNLKKNASYTLNLSGKKLIVKTNDSGTLDNLAVISDSFSPSNTSLTGAPYLQERTFKADGTVDTSNVKSVTSGSIDLGTYSIQAIKDNFTTDNKNTTSKYLVRTTTADDGDAKAAVSNFENLDEDIRAGLKNAGITVKADDTFDKPVTPFKFTLHMIANNTRTTAVEITVNPNKIDKTYPEISWKLNGVTDPVKVYGNVSTNTIDNIDSVVDGYNYVAINDNVDITAIKKAFTAHVSGTDVTPLPLNVDASQVNTKVAGKYPVVVSAINADNKKTTKVTFILTVGAKGATYKTVKSNGDIPVYKIDGNTVTDTKTTVKNGDTIAVFGDAVKIGDKSYTRINSADSDLYVESQYVDGSFKPAPSVAKKVMHNSYIYDANHKRVGDKTLAAYTNINVYGDATKLADGSLVYKIGDNQFVMADNIDGTSRTLTHNAYVYKTSKKRADRRVLKKGTKVTTYGNPYKFKNGMSYYRIGGPAKQYVKVANF